MQELEKVMRESQTNQDDWTKEREAMLMKVEMEKKKGEEKVEEVERAHSQVLEKL